MNAAVINIKDGVFKLLGSALRFQSAAFFLSSPFDPRFRSFKAMSFVTLVREVILSLTPEPSLLTLARTER